MKLHKIALFTILLASYNLACASSAKMNYINKTAEQLNYIESAQQKVWPGFHPANTPIIAAFDLGHRPTLYAFNFKPISNTWTPLNSNNSNVYVNATSSFGLETSDDNTFKPIENQPSFIDVELTANISVSENFKNKIIANRASYYLANESSINHDHFKFKNAHYAKFNEMDYLKLILLEDAILTYSLQVDDGHAQDAIRDAAAIHQYRSQKLDKNSRDYENGNEIILGIPNYISWASQKLQADEFSLKAQLTGCPPLSELTGVAGLLSCATSGFATFSGTTYSYHLDKMRAPLDWKSNTERNFTSPSNVMANYLQISMDNAKETALKAMSKPEYHYDRISRVTEYLMAPYFEKMKSAIKDYNASSGVTFRLPADFGEALFLAAAFGYEAFDESYSLDNRTVLLQNINLSLPGDDDSTLQFKELSFIKLSYSYNGLNKNEDKSFSEMKLNGKSEIHINRNKVVTLDELSNKDQALEFNSIYINDPHFQLRAREKGKIVVKNGVIRLQGIE